MDWGGEGGVKKQQQQRDRCYFNSKEAAENRGLRPEHIGSNKEQAHDPSSYTLSVSKTLANNCWPEAQLDKVNTFHLHCCVAGFSPDLWHVFSMKSETGARTPDEDAQKKQRLCKCFKV